MIKRSIFSSVKWVMSIIKSSIVLKYSFFPLQAHMSACKFSIFHHATRFYNDKNVGIFLALLHLHNTPQTPLQQNRRKFSQNDLLLTYCSLIRRLFHSLDWHRKEGWVGSAMLSLENWQMTMMSILVVALLFVPLRSSLECFFPV